MSLTPASGLYYFLPYVAMAVYLSSFRPRLFPLANIASQPWRFKISFLLGLGPQNCVMTDTSWAPCSNALHSADADTNKTGVYIE